MSLPTTKDDRRTRYVANASTNLTHRQQLDPDRECVPAWLQRLSPLGGAALGRRDGGVWVCATSSEIRKACDVFIPLTMKQALSCTDKDMWRQAKDAEMHQIQVTRKGFTPRPRIAARGHVLLRTVWVFTCKDSEPDPKDGHTTLAFKTRLTARGDLVQIKFIPPRSILTCYEPA
jgi:hypothetical protein